MGFNIEALKQYTQDIDEMYGGNFKQLNNMSQPQHEYLYEQLRNATGSKSISDVCGAAEPKLASLKKPTQQEQDNLMQTLLTKEQTQLTEREQAAIELSYIRAAIALAKGSNAIGAEIIIGPITVGVSVNERLVPALEAEAHEIEKYLMGQPNNYE